MPASAVLVHGMWYGAWCYEHVMQLLPDHGIDATAVQLTHSGDLERDVAAVRSALNSE